MLKKILYGIGGVALLFIVIAITSPTPDTTPVVQNTEQEVLPTIIATTSSPEITPPTQKGIYYSVTLVVDGDTIKISKDGKEETLRLIGIDTPETVDPRKPVQCFGKEASNKTKELLLGRKVAIEQDASQDTRDKYGRLLVYVYRDDGLFFNKYLLEEGYAHEYTYAVAYKYQAEFKKAQQAAQTQQKGLWAPNACSTTITPIVTTPTPANSNIICSANTYNCGDFKTHAEAQNVFIVCGGVNNDIHRLDGDKDGQACEDLP